MFRVSITAALTNLCIAVTAPDPASAQDHLSDTFGEWYTFCDRGRICDAYTYSGWEWSQNPQSGHVFNLRRMPGSSGWTMRITFDGVEPKLSLGLEASVIRMGHDQVLIPPFYEDSLVFYRGRLIVENVEKHDLYLVGTSAENLMRQLRQGDFMAFEFGGCQDKFLYAGFSLAGITAALAWIDKVQGQPGGSVDVVHSIGTEEGPYPNCGE